MRLRTGIITAVFLLTLMCAGAHATPAPQISFSHLEKLRRVVVRTDGKRLVFWHSRVSYKDPRLPSLGFSFEESAESGAASTVDQALTTLAYLKHFERSKSAQSLARAREALETLLGLQDGAGLFRRGLRADGTLLDEAGQLDLSTAFAMRALAAGYRVFSTQEPAFAETLERAMAPFLAAQAEMLKDVNRGFGNYVTAQQMRVPRWLPAGRGDVASLLVLAMVDCAAVKRSPALEKMIGQICRGICESQLNGEGAFPYRAYFLSSASPLYWKVEDNYQVAALVAGADLLGSDEVFQNARDTANSLYPFVLTSTGPTVSASPYPEMYPQNGGCALAMATGLMALHRKTGQEHYAVLAGLGASWIMGNNSAGAPLYEPASGRCSEGAIASETLNSYGAGAAARALLCLMEVADTPQAVEALSYTRGEIHSYQVVEAEHARGINEAIVGEEIEYPDGVKRKSGLFANSNPAWIGFRTDLENYYFIYAIQQKMPVPADWLEILYRLDGGKVLRVTAGGVNFTPELVAEKIYDSVWLSSGRHTLGIQGKGKLMTQKVSIDCIVVQPALQTGEFHNGKKGLIVAQNLKKDLLALLVPASKPLGSIRCFDASGGELPPEKSLLGADAGIDRPNGDRKRNGNGNGKKEVRRIRVEPAGFTLVRW